MILSFDEFKKLKTNKTTYGLFGNPIKHTISPKLHNIFFRHLNIDADYVAISVTDDELEEAVNVASKKLAGINITIPHKTNVIKYLDNVNSLAKKLDSVNTIDFTNNDKTGYNTDYFGFLKTLEIDNISIKDKNVLCLGNGGTANVICAAVINNGGNLTIAGRDIKKINMLKNQLETNFDCTVNTTLFSDIDNTNDIIINCTSVGMYPNINDKILTKLDNRVEYIFDCIYNPTVTSFLNLENDNVYLKKRNGLLMLIYQGMYAEKIWNNIELSNDILSSIEKELSSAL